MWFLARLYDAQQALEMGLVNTVVPLERLEEETLVWFVPSSAELMTSACIGTTASHVSVLSHHARRWRSRRLSSRVHAASVRAKRTAWCAQVPRDAAQQPDGTAAAQVCA